MKTLPKPKRHAAKNGRVVSNSKAEANAPPQTAAPVSERAAVTLGMPSQAETQAANRLFRQQAEKIADVHVTSRPGENPWEPIYSVEVPDLWSEAFDKIVALRGRLYRKYPEAIINIQFRPLRELAEAANSRRLADV